jgi:hypothetical protein
MNAVGGLVEMFVRARWRLLLVLLSKVLWLLQVTLLEYGSTKLIGKSVAVSNEHGGKAFVARTGRGDKQEGGSESPRDGESREGWGEVSEESLAS